MLIKEESKCRFCEYMADLILNFISLSKDEGMIDSLLKSVDDKDSQNYSEIRNLLIMGLRKSFDNRENELVFNEINHIFKRPM